MEFIEKSIFTALFILLLLPGCGLGKEVAVSLEQEPLSQEHVEEIPDNLRQQYESIKTTILSDTDDWLTYVYNPEFPDWDPQEEEKSPNLGNDTFYSFKYPPDFEMVLSYGEDIPAGRNIRHINFSCSNYGDICLSIYDQGWIPLPDMQAIFFESEGLKTFDDWLKLPAFSRAKAFEINGLYGLRLETDKKVNIILNNPVEDYAFILFEVYGDAEGQLEINTLLLDQVLSTFSF